MAPPPNSTGTSLANRPSNPRRTSGSQRTAPAARSAAMPSTNRAGSSSRSTSPNGRRLGSAYTAVASAAPFSSTWRTPADSSTSLAARAACSSRSACAIASLCCAATRSTQRRVELDRSGLDGVHEQARQLLARDALEQPVERVLRYRAGELGGGGEVDGRQLGDPPLDLLVSPGHRRAPGRTRRARPRPPDRAPLCCTRTARVRPKSSAKVANVAAVISRRL